MRIALVHDFLNKLGGAERVLKEFHQQYPDAPIFCLTYDEKKVGKIFPRTAIRTSALQKWYRLCSALPFAKTLPTRILLGGIPRAVEAFDLSEYDVVICSHTAWSHGVITGTGTTHICYYHSPMRFAWDYTNEYKQAISKAALAKTLMSKQLHHVRNWDRIASARPDICLANSSNVAHRVEKYYQREATVLYPPVDVDDVTPTKKKKDYFLIVSTLARYKAIDLVIEVFNKIDRPLMIIGDGPDRRRLQAMAEDNITFRGFLSDKEVEKAMAQARGFLFPGEDDFGMTPVEVMAHGTPVIAFGKGGALEVVQHGENGILFPKQTARSLEDALAQFFRIEAKFDHKKIAKSAQRFSKRVFWKQWNKLLKPVLPQK